MLGYIFPPALSPLMIFLQLFSFHSLGACIEMLSLYVKVITMLADCHSVKAEFLPPILLRNSPGSQNTGDYFTR